MNRKGDAFIFLLNIFFLLAVILIFSKLHAAFTLQNANEGIGTRQAALLHTYATSEQMLLYVDEAAKFAAYESLATAMEKGGQNSVTPKCPEMYAGYRQWTRAAAPHDCLPNATINGTVYELFKKEMMLNTRKYLANYPGFPMGINYDIMLKPGNGLTVIGLTKDQITLPIVSAKDARQQAITPLLQDTAKSELDFRQDTTLTATVVPSVNRKPRVEQPTNITIQSTRTVDAATAIKRYTEGQISTHYLIDEQGRITQLVPEDQRAFVCDTCARIEEAGIIISLVNSEPVAPVEGKCAEGELLKDACRTCQPACYAQYTQPQIDRLKELLADIVNRHDLPVQNINLQGRLLGTDNPGPALREGSQQSAWLAQLLIDIAADKARESGEQETVEEKPAQYQTRNQVIQLAEAEWQYFNQGSAKECSLKVRERIEEYFESASCPAHGVCGSESGQYSIPWSAAFISYTMRNSNVDFPYSCSHFDYFTKIRDNPQEYQCTTHRMSELSQLQPGDLLCACRDPSCVIKYEDPMRGQSSHCDIVTEVNTNDVVVIGGNVGNSVMKRRIPKSSLQRYFGFISCGGGKPACGVNSMPLDAAGDDDVTATLAKIRTIPGLEEQINKSGEEHGVDPKLMIAQIAQESDGNTHLVSTVGALGIAQFMPDTAQQYYPAGSRITACGCAETRNCKRADPSCAADDIRRNPHLSVEAQAKLMADNIKRNDQYTDKMQFGLAEYNWGGRIRTAIAKAKEQTGKSDPSWQEVRPHTPQETQNYVDRIMRHYTSLGGSTGSFQDIECENFFVKEMGTYSFAPAFTVAVPDLLTAVNRTAEWAKETYETCDGSSDNRRCLEDSIDEFNSASRDLEISMCEDPVPAAMNDLQQVITDCKENRQDACGCVWKPNVEMQILMTGSRQLPVPTLYAPSQDIDQLPAGWIDQGQPLNRALLITTGQRSSIRISDAFGRDAERVDVDSLRFVKDGNQMMLSLDDAPLCGVYKTTHQVCAQVKQRIPILSRGAEFETPKIKFALFLNDSRAPDVAAATVVNITGGLIVTIVHPSDDVSYYKVACSATPVFGTEQFVDARRRTSSGDELVNPFTTTLTLCNGQPILPEQTYYVRIAAVDISGNRGKDAIFQANQMPIA